MVSREYYYWCLLLIRSYYSQPFGSFSGTLPGGIELKEAYGVMERHEAHW